MLPSKVRVIVNRHTIKSNGMKLKQGESRLDPPLSIHWKGTVIKAHYVQITIRTDVVYRPDKPLKCGATVWIYGAATSIRTVTNQTSKITVVIT